MDCPTAPICGAQAVDVEQRLRVGEVGREHVVHVHRHAEPQEQLGEQAGPLGGAEAARDGEAPRIVAAWMAPVDEVPDLLVGVAHRLRLRAGLLAREQLVDRAAAAEREREHLAAARVAAGQRGTVAARRLVVARRAVALHDLLVEARVQQAPRVDLDLPGRRGLLQRADQPQARAVAGVRQHEREGAPAHLRLQAVRDGQRQRLRQHGLAVQQHDAAGRQLDLVPQRSRHVLDDRPVRRGQDLGARHALGLQLARVLHQEHGAGGVDHPRPRRLEGLGAGRGHAGHAEHRREGVHQAAGAGRALQVHRVVEQFGLGQRDRRDLGVLAADVHQDAQVLAHALHARGLQPRDVRAQSIEPRAWA
jgi:hypothetical protein